MTRRRPDPALWDRFTEERLKPHLDSLLTDGSKFTGAELKRLSRLPLFQEPLDAFAKEGSTHGTRAARERAAAQVQASVEEDEQPSDADDAAHEVALAQASASKRVKRGTPCPICRVPTRKATLARNVKEADPCAICLSADAQPWYSLECRHLVCKACWDVEVQAFPGRQGS